MVELTRSAWSNIVRINAEVNSIPALTDMEIYGVEEFWEYPTSEQIAKITHFSNASV